MARGRAPKKKCTKENSQDKACPNIKKSLFWRQLFGWVWSNIYIYIWLVVSTPLKNIRQLGWVFPIYGKNVPNHQPYIYNMYIYNMYIYIYNIFLYIFNGYIYLPQGCGMDHDGATSIADMFRGVLSSGLAQKIWGKAPKFGVWLSWFHIVFLQFWWFFIILSIIICFSF